MYIFEHTTTEWMAILFVLSCLAALEFATLTCIVHFCIYSVVFVLSFSFSTEDEKLNSSWLVVE